ncbi:hypothetical protein DX933_06095 [Ornithinibacillus gellani]|uniref:hypothetical protein n=1 Tax=Ornithinibacillus gellani TaxID=2293253 RepID=UPI000F475BCC|nr:hypothetical protein [Ornithinibacillus gellani]TQS75836.1 hypothetical protein DX933_06095 [Ornithinibacillus gellani]
MKKYLSILFISLLIIAGCNGQKSEEAKPKNTNENKAADTDQSTAAFQNIEVVHQGEGVIFTGEAKATNQAIYYKIVQGEKTVLEEKQLKLKEADEWESVEWTVEVTDEMKDNPETPIIHLYGKNKQGEPVNPNYVPVDLYIY